MRKSMVIKSMVIFSLLVIVSLFLSGCQDGPLSGQVYKQIGVCGDGTKNPKTEQCDDGNLKNGDGCSSLCKKEAPAVCGNNKKELGEGCDGSDLTGIQSCEVQKAPPGYTLKCWPDCKGYSCVQPCGNGKVEGNEQCDDGNLKNGDGCSATCQSEKPDLVVSYAKFEMLTNASGKYANVTATVKNVGLTSTGVNFHMLFNATKQVRLSPPLEAVALAQYSLNSLYQYSASLYLPCPQDLSVGIAADDSVFAEYQNKIAEADETNNNNSVYVTC